MMAAMIQLIACDPVGSIIEILFTVLHISFAVRRDPSQSAGGPRPLPLPPPGLSPRALKGTKRKRKDMKRQEGIEK